MEVVIAIEEGKIRGKYVIGLNDTPFYSFQGIPYAKPPLGELRFKAPRPVEKWSGIKDCTKEGSACFSRHMIYENQIIGSEDCLVLNVFSKGSPQHSEATKPVMVWIHGGGFVNGTSGLYGPDFFMTKDIVLVTINYRIGILGFLSFENPNLGILGNAGLKDQVMALKWVRRNIKHFGGDPGNITIFGESVGAASVHYLILSPMATGLFHKAILQSGSALNCWAESDFLLLKRTLDVLDCPYTDEKDVLKFLQELPVEKLLEAQDKIGDHLHIHARRYYGPVIEKPSTIEPNFITESPIAILVKKAYNKVPMILGCMSGEGIFTLFYQRNSDFKTVIINFEEAVPVNLDVSMGSNQSKEIAAKIKGFYYGIEEVSEQNLQKFILLHGDIFFVFGVQQSAEIHLKTSDSPIYFYRFSVEGQRNLFKITSGINLPGACHADELSYLFHMGFPEFINNDITPNSLEDKTIKRMIGFWTNFAKSGNPNPTELDDLIDVVWKPVTKIPMDFLEIGNELKMDVNPNGERMKFWKEIYNSVKKHN